MVFYGIAAAITGDPNRPQFHCNVLKLDSAKITPLSKEYLEKLSQPRVIEQVEFEPLPDLSFRTDPTNINDTNALQETAKRFLTVLNEVITLQQQTEYPEAKVPVAIGDEAANAPYQTDLLAKTFIQADPTQTRKLLEDCQFQLNSYHFYDNGSTKTNAEKNDPIINHSRNFLKALNRQNFKQAQHAINKLKEYLLRLFTFLKKGGFEVNPNQRFLWFESAGFEPLDQDPCLKHVLIEVVRKVLSIGPQYLHIKTDREKRPPFIDVLKTLLLDKYSELIEDHKVRFSDEDDKLVKGAIQKIAP